MKNIRPESFIFDMDGTIVSTLEDIADSVNFGLEKFNLPLRSYKEIEGFLGNGSNLLIKRSLPADRQDLFQEVFDVYYEHYLTNFCVKTKPFDGLIPALEYAKSKGVLLFVYTNKPHDIALEVLKRSFPEGLFEKLVGIPLNGVVKPDPNAFLKACEEYHLDYSRSAFFGDSTTDIRTGHNLHCGGIYSVLWGYQSKEKLSSIVYRQTAFLTEPKQIRDVVDGII